jgi:mannose/cellobiose epimerase-like protein (N-acyl-D-glucosamine 2-epimerase family)
MSYLIKALVLLFMSNVDEKCARVAKKMAHKSNHFVVVMEGGRWALYNTRRCMAGVINRKLVIDRKQADK